MSDQSEVKEELHEMRNDFKEMSKQIATLTKVLIRKEERDKHLEIRVEKLEDSKEDMEKRIRKNEDFITKTNPWLTMISKVSLAALTLGALIFLGLKA